MDNSKNNLFYFDNSYDQPVAGVDEVGRGPLAGPVVAAAVIIDINNIPVGINAVSYTHLTLPTILLV